LPLPLISLFKCASSPKIYKEKLYESNDASSSTKTPNGYLRESFAKIKDYYIRENKTWLIVIPFDFNKLELLTFVCSCL
jgi:hypothetical protein